MSPARSSANERSTPRAPGRRPVCATAMIQQASSGSRRAPARARRSPRAASPRRTTARSCAAGEPSSQTRRASALRRGCVRPARRRRAAARRRRCVSPSAGPLELRLGLGERVRGVRRPGRGSPSADRSASEGRRMRHAPRSATLDLLRPRRRGHGRRRRGTRASRRSSGRAARAESPRRRAGSLVVGADQLEQRPKRSTGSSSAMSERLTFSSPKPAVSSAIPRCSSASSPAGATSTSPSVSSERA